MGQTVRPLEALGQKENWIQLKLHKKMRISAIVKRISHGGSKERSQMESITTFASPSLRICLWACEIAVESSLCFNNGRRASQIRANGYREDWTAWISANSWEECAIMGSIKVELDPTNMRGCPSGRRCGISVEPCLWVWFESFVDFFG